jgi:hypothetical protein
MCGAEYRAQLTPNIKPANVNEVPGARARNPVLPRLESRYTNDLAKLRQRMAQAHRRSKVRAQRGTFDHVELEIAGA